jgi:site-specific DNA-methyltransferase (adenine-specific)
MVCFSPSIQGEKEMNRTTIGTCDIYHGDCIEVISSFSTKVDHFICDPPYDSEAHKQFRPRRKKKGGARDRDDLDFIPLDDRLRIKVCAEAKRLCDGWFIAFCQTEQVSFWRDSIESEELKYKSPMVWVKPDATPKMNGQGPAIGYESMVTAWCGKGYSRWSAGGKRGVYTHLTNSKTRHGVHKTEKPLLLMRELILDFTDHGQIILDPFAGSGTTGVAAVQLGRRCILIEQDAKYFDICCERVHAATKEADMFIPYVKLKQTSLDIPHERVERTARGAN